jgi:hypothetical protein
MAEMAKVALLWQRDTFMIQRFLPMEAMPWFQRWRQMACPQTSGATTWSAARKRAALSGVRPQFLVGRHAVNFGDELGCGAEEEMSLAVGQRRGESSV